MCSFYLYLGLINAPSYTILENTSLQLCVKYITSRIVGKYIYIYIFVYTDSYSRFLSCFQTSVYQTGQAENST